MEVRWHVILIIVGASVVTFLPRVIPLVVLSRMNISGWAMRWLNYVPIAVMAALIGQQILVTNGKPLTAQNNMDILAALPAFLVAVFTRSLLGTVLAGVISIAILRFVGL